MEELTDFDNIIQEYLKKEIVYCAKFNVDTGSVSQLGPKNSFDPEETNLIEVEKNTAELILSGDVPLGTCFVDVVTQTFEIIETKSITKIDDVLHRVVDINWTTIDFPDVYVNCKDNKIIVELAEELGGTYKNPIESRPRRKVFWSNDTVLSFLVTSYNDPHIVYHELTCKLQDLLQGPVQFDNIEYNKQCSLYTRRMFKNYVMDFE